MRAAAEQTTAPIPRVRIPPAPTASGPQASRHRGDPHRAVVRLPTGIGAGDHGLMPRFRTLPTTRAATLTRRRWAVATLAFLTPLPTLSGAAADSAPATDVGVEEIGVEEASVEEADVEGTGVWPLAGQPDVVTAFSPPDERWGRGHRGVDLAGAPAQPVLAALDGEVTFAGTIAGLGVVVVSHGPTRTTYQPVVADVRVSQNVEAGDRLGWLHPAGSHCAPAACLHWGWRLGDLYLDPLDLVGGTGVRLLPLWGLPGLWPGALQARGWAWE